MRTVTEGDAVQHLRAESEPTFLAGSKDIRHVAFVRKALWLKRKR